MKVMENCGVFQYPQKNVVMEILGMERENLKSEAKSASPCRNTIKLFLQKLGGKRELASFLEIIPDLKAIERKW